MTHETDADRAESDPGVCVICEKPIPEMRLELAPQAKTCSKICSRELDLSNRRRASKAHYDRKKRARGD